MSSVTVQKSYRSHDRQQQIFSDISLIIKLISCHKKGIQMQQKPQNIKNSQRVSSSSLINQSSFSNNHSSFSANEFANFYPSYKQYGKNFNQLTYSDLLYLLCRKKVLHEFIMEFIEEKYTQKKLQGLHYKMVENIRVVMEKNQPQISLSECLNSFWSEILSKEDVFEDAVDLLGWNISKNWRSNNIKIQKKLQKSQALIQQGSRIFQTQPSLLNISLNPLTTTTHTQTRKKVIQESTRHILSGLQQLKKQMIECQAEMNMAKNNDDKIVQKGKHYSQKMRQYNEMKEEYRKRTLLKEQMKQRNLGREILDASKINNESAYNEDGNRKNSKVVNNSASKNGYTNEFMGSENELSKINEQGSEHGDKEQADKNKQDNKLSDFSQQSIIKPKNQRNSQTMQRSMQNIAKYAQDSELSVSIVLDDKRQPNVKAKLSHPPIINSNSKHGIHQPLSTNQQPLKPHECDQLIRILDVVRKNELRQNRIKNLTNQKDSTPLEMLKTFKKKHLSIDVNYPQKPCQQHENSQNPLQYQQSQLKSSQLQPSPTKSFNRSPQKSISLTSPKQFLLQNYIQKVFNHYIMQQSKMKTIHLFDSTLSGSQLGYNSSISNNIMNTKHQSKLNNVSPHLRKKFSTQVNEHDLNKDDTNNYLMQQRRRKSLAYTNDRSQYNTSTKQKDQNQSTNRTCTLTNSISIKKQQPQLTIESYSKFIRAFQLANKTVTFNDIIKIFKQKSQNKRTITFNQFIQLFELIYRLECQRLQIEFTPLLFDAYLRKEVFDWDKINRVLRIKTIDTHPEKGQIRYNTNDNTPQSNYQRNLVGHSGMLREDLIEKINASKKPFTKMPCMNQNNNRLKTLPNNITQELPQTKIQQKVQEIKRLRELQKARKTYELQEYLKEARQRDQTFMMIKDQMREKTQDSYAVRFKNLQSRRKQAQERKKHKISGKNSIINESKLKKQFRIDTIEQDYIEDQKYIKKGIFKSNMQGQDVTEGNRSGQNDKKVKKSRNRIKPMKTQQQSFIIESQKESQLERRNSSHVRNQQVVINNEQNRQRRKSRQDMMELQKIIGLRESQDEYQDEYQNEYQNEITNQMNERSSRFISPNYSQVKNMPVSKPSTNNYQPSSRLNKNQQLYQQQNTKLPHKQIANKQYRPKQNKTSQEDQYLANFLKKQSFQIDQLNIMEDDGHVQRDWLKNYDRQNWKVHF